MMTDSFAWSCLGLNKHEFTAFGNLLALRNGGQVEPASLYEDDLDRNESENGSENDSETSIADTNRPVQISNVGHDGLKRKFLDCLAEFASNKKGGKSVACTAMREADESVSIWIARNEGFQSVEKGMFEEKLASLLSELSVTKEEQSLLNVLWDLMLEYQHDRLEEYYIPSLRSSLKDCNELFNISTSDRFSSALSEVSDLRDIAFGVDELDKGLLHRHGKLAKKAFDIRKMNTVQELLQSSVHATSKSRKLWESICFLGKVRVAFEKFKKTALEMPNFSRVEIHLVPYNKAAAQSPLIKAITLEQTFALLRLPFKESTVKVVVSQKWTLRKAEQEFAKRQKQKLNVHAEVQMVLFFSQEGQEGGDLLPYFGCSKYSCFMCSRFLRAHGKIQTRGCHGRLFKPWTVPDVVGLANGSGEKLAKAMVQVQKGLKMELKSVVPKELRHVKTSVLGGQSVFTENDSIEGSRKEVIKKMRLKAERERVAGQFRRLALEEAAPRFEDLAVNPVPLNGERDIEDSDYLDECGVCTKQTSRKCSICKKDAFCSTSCEEKRSDSHLFSCTKRPLTTADYLWRDITEDIMPEDEDVRKDFGFNQLTSFADRSKLLGLYKGLWYSENITVDDIHKWQVEGSLIAHIKEYFYNIPEQDRGAYFPWFLNNISILERSTTREEAMEKLVSTFFDESKSYLDEEDRQKDFRDLEPEAKRHAYCLLAATLHASTPNPTEINWTNFGFCTCTLGGDGALGGLYQKLLLGPEPFVSDLLDRYRRPPHLRMSEGATFSEFWRAFESGSLIQLMDDKGLKAYRSGFPYLETYLSVPPSGPQPSVWDLKQFLAINDPAEFPPIPAVEVDYGFMNCGTFTETCILMEIYTRLLLKANPLELHEACLAGRLFEFAGRFDAMDEAHKCLMRNPYPLERE